MRVMEVVIDRKNCGSCQLCADACPEMFEMCDGEILIMYDAVPPEMLSDCRYAQKMCPTQSIRILEASKSL